MVGSISSTAGNQYDSYALSATKARPAAGKSKGAADAGGPDTVEFSAQLMQLLDQNKDGALSSDEVSPTSQPTGAMPSIPSFMQALLQGADSDGDGSISASELQTKLTSADGNGDGKLSFAELISARTDATSAGASSGVDATASATGPAGAGHHSGGARGAGASKATDPRDLNGDGVVSLDEMLAAITGELPESSGAEAGDDADGSSSADSGRDSDSGSGFKIDAKQLASLLQTS